MYTTGPPTIVHININAAIALDKVRQCFTRKTGVYLLRAAADLAFNSGDGEFPTSWTKDGSGPLLELPQRDDVGG